MRCELDSCLQELSDVCRRLGVKRLDLFGSAARGDFDPESSDLDFVVQFASPQEPGYADRYLDLAEQLEKLFARPVDLMTERSLRNPILKQVISRDRRTLYAT